MTFNGIPEFDLFGLDDNFGHPNFGFHGSNPDPTSVAGPSQPGGVSDTWGDSNYWDPSQSYTGAEVWSDFGNYPNTLEFLNPTYAPTSLYPADGGFAVEGNCPSFYQGSSVIASFPFDTNAPLPIPTLSYGGQPLPSELYPVPVATTHSFTHPQAVPNPDSLNWSPLAAAGSSPWPVAHPSPTYNPPWEEVWYQYLPEPPLPTPTASSSGPERTRRPAKKTRRYNPFKPAKKADPKEEEVEEGWDSTLVRFRPGVDTLLGAQDGQPLWGLTPAMALAKIDKLIKEDLKQSPLRRELGRCRDAEDYMKGLLKVIRSVPVPEGGSDKDETTVDFIQRLADELEAKLAPVNRQPMLAGRTMEDAPEAEPGTDGEQKGRQVGKTDVTRKVRKARKNKVERKRRDDERQALENISLLFREPGVSRIWAKWELLSLVMLFLLYGPTAFARGAVEVRSSAPGP